MFLTIVMTVGTGQLRMTAEQLEVCDVVIEALLAQTDDICIPTQVIYVAACTAIFIRFREKAVKSDSVANIACDIFVADQAQPSLLAAIECEVAGATFCFDIRVPFDDLARHNERLDLGMGIVGCDRCEHQY